LTGQSPRRVHVIRDGLAAHLPDIDPEETAEWLDSFDAVLDAAGQQRARYLMLRMLQRARERHVGVPSLTSTDYVNTIPTDREPWFPGDEEAERSYRRFIRWNAAMTVHRAQRPGIGVGGHISSYASSAAMYEVGFNHFFRGKDLGHDADMVYYQGHAAPGPYARAFLEGRLSEEKLRNFGHTRSDPTEVLWNFEKFLFNRHGKVVARFSPKIQPDSPEVVAAIEKELAKK